MTKKEIIFTIIERLKANGDDSSITEELISSMIDNKRSLLLKQRFSKSFWNIPIEIKQEICLDLSLYNAVDGYSGAGKIIKTKDPLPSSIKIKAFNGPLLIRREDGRTIPFNLIPIERLPYIASNRYTAMLTYVALDLDGKLMLISSDDKLKFLKSIRVTDIFENPDEIYSLECKENNSNTVEPWDIEYPVESSMVNDIVNMVVSDLAKSLNIPEDRTNNADGQKG